MQEGYALAAVLGLTKDAAMHNVAECLDQTMRDANTDADLLGSFLVTLAQQHKQAADDGAAGEGEDHSKPGDETSGAGEAAGSKPSPDTSIGGPPAGGGPAGAMGGTPPGLEALLAGGDDTGEASLASQPPSEEEALQELVAALEELGIPIEALAQAGDATGAGGEMGGNAAGGGVPGGIRRSRRRAKACQRPAALHQAGQRREDLPAFWQVSNEVGGARRARGQLRVDEGLRSGTAGV